MHDRPPESRLRIPERELAQQISAVERGCADRLGSAEIVGSPASRAHVVGVTGPPGSGKSTLVDALITRIRNNGATVAVLAVDPSSRRTGGAVLGDRIRMPRHSEDPGVFVRSMATRGSTQGLAAAARDAVRAIEAAGYDVVIVETVGIGQVELGIVGLADTVVVLCVPGLGDIMQMTKAGIMEIGDVFVVNMADRPGLAETIGDLRRALRLGSAHGDTPRPVCSTVATRGEGIADLWAVIDGHRRALIASGDFARRRRAHARAEFDEIVRREWQRRLERRLHDTPHFQAVMNDLDGGRTTPRQAAADVLLELEDR